MIEETVAPQNAPTMKINLFSPLQFGLFRFILLYGFYFVGRNYNSISVVAHHLWIFVYGVEFNASSAVFVGRLEFPPAIKTHLIGDKLLSISGLVDIVLVRITLKLYFLNSSSLQFRGIRYLRHILTIYVRFQSHWQ